ncbi:hypothetical protein RvY_06884 [Ramazzottius varieornatus]|uniref:Uncharacterized protein n=1 Tax=Ramazzottius varieornatus TaxID=947166 RepID=A0A1D1V3F2_RAMVA|nr:hypothetical protein RvY_06884 [Ramazzottius varieornatus]
MKGGLDIGCTLLRRAQGEPSSLHSSTQELQNSLKEHSWFREKVETVLTSEHTVSIPEFRLLEHNSEGFPPTFPRHRHDGSFPQQSD